MDYYLTVEIGGTQLRYGVVNEAFEAVEFEKEPNTGFSEAKDKGEYLAGLLNPWIKKYGKANFHCISLCLASLLNKERTVNYNSPNIKGLDNISLTGILEKRLGMRAFMERDVNTVLLYEIMKGNIDPAGIVIGIFLGTGLGNAMCIDGKIYIGASGSSCELGHIPTAGLDEACGCGKKSCIELLASGKRLAELAKNKYRCPVDKIFTAHGKEPDVRSVVHMAAIATATEITILDPNCVILGGGVMETAGFPFDLFEQIVRENLRIPNPRQSVKFVRASGDPAAGIVGAALNARGKLLTGY
ncbi:MAG: allose kinase [Fusobacteriaceae bacterium]|jgi:allose kinase|nr:allose kinase [Fusobacteriaceae bacterium]